jgi:hypothetical protein
VAQTHLPAHVGHQRPPVALGVNTWVAARAMSVSRLGGVRLGIPNYY